MPTLAAAHRLQQVDKESLQTLTRPGDLGFSHARGYQYQNILSILNVVILSAGLELLANYTYSRCMSNQELNTGDFNNPPGFRAQWLPGFGIAPDYALDRKSTRLNSSHLGI